MLQVRGLGYKDSEAPADPLGTERPEMGRRVQGIVLKVAKGRGEPKMEKRGDLQVEPGRCQKSEPKVLKAQGRGERASGLVAETPTRLTHRNQSFELRRPRGERQDVGTACLGASSRPPAPQGGIPEALRRRGHAGSVPAWRGAALRFPCFFRDHLESPTVCPAPC